MHTYSTSSMYTCRDYRANLRIVVNNSVAALLKSRPATKFTIQNHYTADFCEFSCSRKL